MATIDELAEARSAYHELLMGKAARVVIDSNGEKVEFVAANSQKLYLYIQQLEALVGSGVTTPVTRGPAGFVF